MRSGEGRAEASSSTASREGGPATGKAMVAITGRALLVGTLTVAVLSFACPYLGAVTHTWDPGGSALPATGVITLFALVMINGALVRLLPGRALSRAELLVTYAMTIMVVQFLYKGGMPFITGATTWPFYMATPTNDWAHRMWPTIPLWLRLSNQQAVTWYWEGLPEGTGVPWGAWKWPVLAWASFTMALMGAMVCLGSLLSRDWIERQRLAFPLVEIPLAITGEESRPTLGTSILRNRIFWLGFSIPGVASLLGWLHTIFPNVPSASLSEVSIGRYFGGMGLPWEVLSGDSGIHFSITYPLIGVAYLLPGEVSFSLWLFYVLYRVQQLLWAVCGVGRGGSASVAIDPQTFISMEEAGGFIALSAVVLYQSRAALRRAWSGLGWAFVGRARSDDSTPLAGHWAVLGFVLANAFMLWWALRAGMPWWPFVLVMALFYTVMIGVSRLVAAAGLTHVDTGTYPPQVIFSAIGAAPIGSASLTIYGYLANIYMYDPRIVLMAQAMNSFKLLHSARIRPRRFPWAAALAIITMLAVGFPTMIWIAYHWGASVLPDWPVTAPARDVFSGLDSHLRSPPLPDNYLRGALGLGAGVMLGMMIMHSRFIWWPVSPVGFLIASAWSTDRFVWFNSLVGWAASTMVRRYGGLKLYRMLRPAFIGLVLGDYVPHGALAVVSALLGFHEPR